MRVTLGINRAHLGSNIIDASWSARLDAMNGLHRAGIYCHPMVSAVEYIVDNTAGAYYGEKALNETIGKIGYTHGGSDLGYWNAGTGWGNPAEQTRIGELAAWARGGLGGHPSKPLLAVGISAGTMGLINYFGQAGDPADVAAFVLILPPYDMVNLYTNNLGGARAGIASAWGVTYPAALPALSSPKQNAPALAGTIGRIYYAPDDPLNGTTVVNDMLATLGSGWSAINLGNLGHTQAAINAIDKVELASWAYDVAPPT